VIFKILLAFCAVSALLYAESPDRDSGLVGWNDFLPIRPGATLGDMFELVDKYVSIREAAQVRIASQSQQVDQKTVYRMFCIHLRYRFDLRPVVASIFKRINKSRDVADGDLNDFAYMLGEQYLVYRLKEAVVYKLYGAKFELSDVVLDRIEPIMEFDPK